MRKKTSFAFLRGQIVAESPFSRMGEISNFSGEKRGRFFVKMAFLYKITVFTSVNLL